MLFFDVIQIQNCQEAFHYEMASMYYKIFSISLSFISVIDIFLGLMEVTGKIGYYLVKGTNPGLMSL